MLTGGSMGSAVLEAIDASPARDSVDWSRVHFWWGDERWVPDRRCRAQRRAGARRAARPPRHARREHPPVPGLRRPADLDEAADAYAAELAQHGVDGLEHPIFDITFLGVGPDGHIASLFPHRSGIQVTDRTVVAVRNSPKPPPERLSLTRPVHQLVAADLARPRRVPTRPRRSGSPSRARAATRCRSPASRAAGARSSSSTRMPRPRCPRPSSPATTDASRPHERMPRRDAARTNERGQPSGWPLSACLAVRRRQSCGAICRGARGAAAAPRRGALRPPPRCGAPSRRRGASCTARACDTDGGFSLSRPAGRPVDGQSMISGISSSGRFAAKYRTVSLPRASQ